MGGRRYVWVEFELEPRPEDRKIEIYDGGFGCEEFDPDRKLLKNKYSSYKFANIISVWLEDVNEVDDEYIIDDEPVIVDSSFKVLKNWNIRIKLIIDLEKNRKFYTDTIFYESANNKIGEESVPLRNWEAVYDATEFLLKKIYGFTFYNHKIVVNIMNDHTKVIERTAFDKAEDAKDFDRENTYIPSIDTPEDLLEIEREDKKRGKWFYRY